MNWLNRILRSQNKQPASPSTVAARALSEAQVPAADPLLLRQRISLAQTDPERLQLERDLGAALAQAKQTLGPEETSQVRGSAVVHAPDKASALVWLADLADEEILAEVAQHAHFAEVRLAAAQRLNSTATLERVAQASRVKDKGVYRQCMNTLRARRQADDCALRAAALTRELERLLLTDPLPATRLVDLEREFKQLAAVDLGHCERLLEQFRARVQEQSRQLQQLHARHLAAQALADDLARQTVQQQTQWQQFQERWQALFNVANVWPDWLADHKELASLNLLLSQIAVRLGEAGEDLERSRQCEAFLALHGQPETPDEDTLAAWEALDKPRCPALRSDLQARWTACVNRIVRKPASPPPPPTQAPKDYQQVQKLIAQMEAAVEQGHLGEAGKLESEIESFTATTGLSHALSQRFGQVRAQLLKLRGWARWGSDQARQQLIAQVEELALGQDDVDSLSKAIVKLREEWKSLDAHGAATRSLWTQFNAAAERAYAPVAAHRAELAAKREAARLAKEALCLEWENWLAQISWEHADIRVVQAMRQQICDAWRSAAAAGMREERGLRKRYEAVLASVDANIDAARRREVSRCESLISAAEALRQLASLRQAIEEIKTLQQRWRDEALSVRLPRAEQELLWQRFRNACDAVFARRSEEKQQQNAQRAQRAEAAQQRLAELEAMLDSKDIAAVQQCLAEFRAAWRDAKQLTASAKEILLRVEAHLQALQASKRQAPYQLMARKLALLEPIERAAAAGESVDELLRQAETAWQVLPRLAEKFEQTLARRLAAAPGASSIGLAEGSKQREELLLDMEIALGLGSPDAHDAARRARQLQLLQQRFRKDQVAPADLHLLVTRWYATAALSDPAQQRRMDAILEALEKQR